MQEKEKKRHLLTEKHLQHVGHLFAEVGLLARFEALVAILPRNDASQLAHLLGEAGHVFRQKSIRTKNRNMIIL